MPHRPKKKSKREDALRSFSEKMTQRIEQLMFGQWIDGELRDRYTDSESELEKLIDRAEAEGLKIERERTESATHYMLSDPEGVVLSGLKITDEQMLDELGKLAQKMREKQSGQNEGAEDGKNTGSQADESTV